MPDARGEEAITLYCQRARLGPLQTEVVLLHLCDGLTPPQIRLKTKMKRVAEVRNLLEAGLRKLCPQPGFREVLRQTVRPDQFRRLTGADERDLTPEEAMRGPKPAAPATPQIGRTWTEVCFLPGTPKRDGVPVQMAETIHRWW